LSRRRTRLVISRTWNGETIASHERVTLELALDETALLVHVDAPFHDDPPPRAEPGSCDGLWEFEVVELFLLGDSQHYLEIELGPFGHYLVLQLRGPRQLHTKGLPLDYTAERAGDRWSGRARVPVAYLPAGLRSCNAYAIHGRSPARRYLASHPVQGDLPDFHRLDCFRPLDW
jgi:hypothetical protein